MQGRACGNSPIEETGWLIPVTASPSARRSWRVRSIDQVAGDALLSGRAIGRQLCVRTGQCSKETKEKIGKGAVGAESGGGRTDQPQDHGGGICAFGCWMWGLRPGARGRGPRGFGVTPINGQDSTPGRTESQTSGLDRVRLTNRQLRSNRFPLAADFEVFPELLVVAPSHGEPGL